MTMAGRRWSIESAFAGDSATFRFAAFGGLSFGHDVALVAGVLRTLSRSLGLSALERGVVVGATKVGAALGAFGGAALMRSRGRPFAAAIIVGTCETAGAVASWMFASAAHSVAGLALSRIVLGVPIGALAVIVPVYIGENAHTRTRGAVGASYELSLCAGMILANALTWFRPAESLDVVLLSPAVVGFWCAIAFATAPESARWLVRRGDVDGARDALRRSGRDASEAEEELAEITTESDAMVDDANFWSALVDATMGGVREAISGEEKRAVRLALALACFNQLNASTSVINYTPRVLRNIVAANGRSVGADAADMDVYNLYTGLVVLFKTTGVAASMFYVDSIGRRPLLIFGSVAAGGGLTIACVGYAWNSVVVTLLGICLFILAYSMSFASIFWVVVSEFFSMRAKSSCAALVTATLFVSGAISDLLFPVLLSHTGAATFAVYAVVCFVSALFAYVNVPETARKPLRDVQNLLRDGQSRYVVVSSGVDAGASVELGRIGR